MKIKVVGLCDQKGNEFEVSMRIAVIGRVNSNLDYDRWRTKFEGNVDRAIATRFNITDGDSLLNQFVRRYARENDIEIAEFAPASDDDGGVTDRRTRNLAMVEDSDLIVGFVPKVVARKSCLQAPAYRPEKQAIVIEG